MTLLRAFSLAVASIIVLNVTAADARGRRSKPARSDSKVITLLRQVIEDNKNLRHELIEIKQRLRPDSLVTAAPEIPTEPPRNAVLAAPMPIPDTTLQAYESHIARSTKLKDLTPVLADKVAHILAVCPGTRLVSGYRPGARVRGSGRPSLHSRYPSRAADMAGNPNCIRRQLAGWPGGLSNDYGAVAHYHFSYEPKGREWGARFAHYRGSHSRRFARHHRYSPRYARAVTIQTVAHLHSSQ